MGFFGGPSKDVLLQMAQGVASIAMQIQMLEKLDEVSKKKLLSGLKAQGEPTNMNELIFMAASVVTEQDLGWHKKNLYLGMIFGSLVSMGMSEMDANHIKGQIEFLAQAIKRQMKSR
ncbi:MAG: hypothetical protein AABY39_07610 [Nitrospirota bacterium]